MKKTNYKLPGLPITPGSPTGNNRTTPLRATGTSKTSGFNNSSDKPLKFGNASRAATKSPQSTTSWSSVLSSASSGGLVGNLSAAAGFGGGIGSLISGLTSLFGGGKTAPPALTAYQLPTSQEQNVSTGSTVSTPGVYGGPPMATASDSGSAQIVQSVRNALLNSSSLNDVIAEL
jgi:hypothetical protein